ncbi:discoidin domain-containing protein [Anaeromassilibacillus sp. SJQ-5]
MKIRYLYSSLSMGFKRLVVVTASAAIMLPLLAGAFVSAASGDEPTELAHGKPADSYTASSGQAGQEAPNAFDADADSVWQAQSNRQPTEPQWLMVDFGKTETVARVDFTQYNNRAKLFKFQVSADAQTWSDAFYGSVESAADSGGVVSYTVVFPEKSGRYFRLWFEETAVNGVQTQPAIFDMKVYDKAGDAETSSAITDITAAIKELAHGRPADSYTASSGQAGQEAPNAFDASADSVWQAQGGLQTTEPQWLMVDFGKTETVARVDFTQYNNRAKLFKFQVSADAQTWSDAFYGSVESAADSGGVVSYTVAFPEASGRYFRLWFEETAADSTGQQVQPAIFDMKVYDKPGDAETSPAITDITAAIKELAHGKPADSYTASSGQAGQEAPNAFDASADSVWQAQGGLQTTEPQWLMVDFGKTETVARVDFTQYNNRAKLFKFQVSADAQTWSDAFYGSVESAADSGGVVSYTVVFPEASGRYFRLWFEETAADSTGQQVQPAIFDMKVYNKPGDAETSPAITDANSSSIKELAHGKPADSYTASSANEASQGAANAFDADADSVWQAGSQAQNISPQWLMVDFGQTETVARVDFSQYCNRIRQFKFQVSHDGKAWTSVYFGSIPSAVDNGGTISYTVVFPEASGRYFRTVFIETAGKTGAEDIQSMPAIFDMKIYNGTDGAATSPAVEEGLIGPDKDPVDPTTKPKNLALNKGESAYTSSSNMDGQTPQNAFDGNPGTNWQNSGNSFPAWLQVDLGSKTDVNGLWVSQWSNRIKFFKIHVSDDGQNWSTAFYGRVTDAAELGKATELSIAFPTVQARFVRLTIIDGVYDEPNKQLFTIPIYEVEVYHSEDWESSETVVDVETELPTAETLAKLKDVLKRVEALDEASYTGASYETLRQAIEKAKPYESGTLGNNTLVLELIAELENAEKALIPLSTYTALRERLKQVLQMNEADYHPDDWNALMQLVEYANVLVAQETADPADVGFYVKSIDILLASMRMADEEELDYTYEINPIREDDYIAETVVIDAGDGGSVNTGVTAVSTAVLLAVPVSLAVMLRLRKRTQK